MKILAIRIKNLASLEGATEIDFTQEPLCSAGIFAITGPTGAGKSTILDALCLALYCKTPRYLQAKETGVEIQDVQGDKISQNDVRAILRDGTADGFAEVDFVGVDGNHYRARWNVRRSRNKVDGTLQNVEVGLKNLSKNTDIGGRKTDLLPEIERLVGLNFEQFRRSVLLPQGDFTAFLKADKDEKSSLLEKLTGTEVYSEISKKVHERHRDELQKLKDLNLQREGIETLTTEELDSFKARKEALENNLKQYDNQLAAVNKELIWHQTLSSIKIECENAEQLHEKALEDKENAQPRILKLSQTEQVQAVRTWFDARTTTESQKTDREIAITTLENQIKELQNQRHTADDLLKKTEEALAVSIKEREDAQPFLGKARELDVQIREKDSQVGKANEDFETAEKKRRDYEKQLNEKEKEAANLNLQIGELERWKTDNATRQPIAENEAVIVSKLSDAKKQLAYLQALGEEIKDTDEEIQKKSDHKNKLNIEYLDCEAKLQKAQNKITAETSALASISITSLEDEKRKIDSAVEELITASAQWALLYNAMLDQESLKTRLKKSKEDFDVNTQQLKEITSRLEAVKAQREASFRMLQLAQQAVNKNVEELRAELVPGEECPVCGSREHPFVTHNQQLHDLLEKQKAEHQKNETEYTESVRRQSNLQSTCDHLTRQIEQQERDRETGETNLKNFNKGWIALGVQRECALIADEKKAGWLQQQLTDKRTRQEELQEQIHLYYQQRQALEEYKRQAEQLDKNLTQVANYIKDTERVLISLAEKKDLNDKNLKNINEELEETERQLSPYFANSGWFENWKTDSEAFLERIKNFVTEWRLKSDQLEQSSRQYNLLTASIGEMQLSLKRFSEESNNRKKIWEGLSEACQTLKLQRSQVFNGEAVIEVEKALNQAIESARKTLKDQNDKKASFEASDLRLKALKEQEIQNLELLKKQALEYFEKINSWLSNYNKRNLDALTEKMLEELLSLPLEWIEAERMVLKRIEEAITRSKSILEERRAACINHEQQRASDRSREELAIMEEYLKNLAKQEQEECNNIGFRFRQDQDYKQRISTLLSAIESQTNTFELWAKLYDIIGSADGKKFRQIAQEYTLDVLLSYANIHLEMLSKRYILQRIPNTLGLQVVDQDMGDEIRTVFSLSGGESFLVSLALALGLASLSSSRMKVESLFIDEGFGSLDPQTLNIAMDALERLHNQGRKVGVISHVQEMTERIPVQIRVSKENSGRSDLLIVG